MTFEIPCAEAENTSVEITLQGETYEHRYKWNARNSSWYMSILKEDVLLISGIKILPEVALNKNYNHIEGMPQGWFLVPPSEATEESINLKNFGIDKTFPLLFSSYRELKITG